MRKIKRMLAWVLAVVMTVTMLPVNTLPVKAADNNLWTEYASEVTRNADGVYEISTAAQLAWVAKAANDGTLEQGWYDTQGNHYYTFRLVDDIDLSDHLWIPIGNSYNNMIRFRAVFDGAGHTISGMRVGTPDDYLAQGYGGLFGVLAGSVRELSITDSTVYATSETDGFECYAGLLAGYFDSYSGSVYRCSVDGSLYIEGRNFSYSNRYNSAGGLFGVISKGKVDSCRSNAGLYVKKIDGVIGKASLGGVTGSYADDDSANNLLIINSVSTAETNTDAEASLSLGAFTGSGSYGSIKNSFARITYKGGTGELGQDAPKLSYNLKTAANICAYEKNEGSDTTERSIYVLSKDSEHVSENSIPLGTLKSQDFVNALNSKAQPIEGAKAWSISDSENGGFPNIKFAGLPVYHTAEFISAGETLSTQKIADGDKAEKPDDPARKGYTFLYWYTDDENTEYDFDLPVISDLALNAKWDAHEHTVDFDPKGGSYVYPQVVKTDCKVIKPADPVYNGYVFKGWYEDEAYSNPWDFNAETVVHDMTLYAKWDVSSLPAVAGRITSLRTGAGIEGATVTLSGNGIDKEVRTDTFGFYRIDDIDAGTYEISAWAPGFCSKSEPALTITDGSAGWDAALESTWSGGGGGEEKKVKTIYVNVSCLSTGMKLSRVTVKYRGDTLTGEGMTDENGCVILEEVPDEGYIFEINNDFRKKGWKSATATTSDGSDKKGDLYVNCALEPECQELEVSVKGYDPVSDKDDQPLEGINVTLKGLHPEDNRIVLVDDVKAVTNADGKVNIGWLAPITWVVSAGATPYTSVSETIKSNDEGKLTKNKVTLNLPFTASSIKVNLKSGYADKDIFKNSQGQGSGSTGRNPLKVKLSGVAGTVTEGISRESELDTNGEALFERLAPGAYNLSAAGSVKKYVSVPAGADGKEIYSSSEDTRYGPKYFYAEFNGRGSTNVGFGANITTTLRVAASPVTFSGTLYKADMDKNGEIKVTPLKDVKLAVKPSYYYQQNGAAEKEIRTDNDGHYSVTLLPGLYGVTVKDNFYNDYFGGHLIYHTGATDNCYYDYNMRGWPCYGQWTGTRKSAWAWLSSGTQKPYADIAGMNLSSGDVVADLVMMEKAFTYSLGSWRDISGVGIPVMTNATMKRITSLKLDNNPNRWEVDRNIIYTMDHHTESNGASVTMYGNETKTKDMTGQKFPAVFADLKPGDYTFGYTLAGNFSHLEMSDAPYGAHARIPHDGERNISFYDFPAPGELPANADFPEDYVDIRYPDDPCHNPWPCGTVYDSEVAIDFDKDAQGHRTFADLYDDDNSNGEMYFKFFNRHKYTRGMLTEEQAAIYRRSANIHDFHLDSNYNQNGTWDPPEEPDSSDGSVPDTAEGSGPEDSDTADDNGNDGPEGAVNGEQSAVLNESMDEDIIISGDVSEPVACEGDPGDMANYAWYTDDSAEHMPDDKDAFSLSSIRTALFGYTTDKCPGVLFYLPDYASWEDEANTAIPDGNVELYFNAPAESYLHTTFFPNALDKRNLHNYGQNEKNDLWFKAPVPASGRQISAIDFAHPQNSRNGQVISKSNIEAFFAATGLEVRAVDGENPGRTLDVPVSVTIGEDSYASGYIYTVDNGLNDNVTKVEVTSNEWECSNDLFVQGYYDENAKKAVILVPLSRKLRVFKLTVTDIYGQQIKNADVSFTGLNRGYPVVGTTDGNGVAQIGETEINWLTKKEEVKSGLTLQDYTVRIHAKGYQDMVYTITADELGTGIIATGRKEMAVLNQPVINKDNKEIFDKRGAFIPGVNFTGTQSGVNFVANDSTDNDALFLNINLEIERDQGDKVINVYMIDRKVYANEDYSDVPTELIIPSSQDAHSNPSEVYEWLVKLEREELGVVYWRCFLGDDEIQVSDTGTTDVVTARVPLWELPTDAFCPTFIVMTDKGAIQIYNVEYGVQDTTQLTGIRLNGRQAKIYNAIADMAGAVPPEEAEMAMLTNINLPTGLILPQKTFTATITASDDGYVDYEYKMGVDLVQGSLTPAGSSAPNLNIISGVTGIVVSGEWDMKLAGEDRQFVETFNVNASRKNMDIDDYLPALFKAFPVKLSFDPDPSGGFGYTGTRTVDGKNDMTRESQRMDANTYAGIKGEISGFKAAGKAFPGVGTILESLEKSGAADMGVHLKLRTGVNGTYRYEIVPPAEPTENLDIAVGAGASAGVYAKALGGSVGAEANVNISGDNDKLPDMMEISATMSTTDGFKMNEVKGKLNADAKIYIQTWAINGEKNFNFVDIPFRYKFNAKDDVNDSSIAINEISIKENLMSRGDFEPSVYSNDAAANGNVLVTNYVTIGGHGSDESGSGAAALTDMESKGGNMRVMLIARNGIVSGSPDTNTGIEAPEGSGDGFIDPVCIASTDGLITACDTVTLSDGKLLVAWCEIAASDMYKTCPPSSIKYSAGTVNNGVWTGNVTTVTEDAGMVTDCMYLVANGNGAASLIAVKTGDGPMAARHNIYGYKYSAGGFTGETVLAGNKRIYRAKACSTGDGVFMAYTTDEFEAEAIVWDNKGTENYSFTVNGLEFDVASNGARSGILTGTDDGLELQILENGAFKYYGTVVSQTSPGNPMFAIAENGSFVIGWTTENDTKLYTAQLSMGGNLLKDAELIGNGGRFNKSELCLNGADLSLYAVNTKTVGETLNSTLNAYNMKAEVYTGTDVEVTGIEVTPDKPEIVIGSKKRLTAKVLPVNATGKGVTWSSDHEDIAIVTSNGWVKGIKTGDAVITVTAGNISVKVPVTVVEKSGNSGGDEPEEPVNPVNPSKPKGDYEGKETGEMSVAFTDASIKDGVIYKGTAIKPDVIVKNGERTLIEGIDYSVKYKDNVNAGPAIVTVTGRGNYTGKKELTFTINKKNIGDADVTAGNTVVISGSKASPVIVYNGIVLRSGSDYSGVTNDKIRQDTGITLTGSGKNYTGTRTLTIKALPKTEVKSMAVALAKDTSFTYNGKEHMLTVATPGAENGKQLTVTDKKTKAVLTEGKDFVLSYGNNINAGTAKIRITGQGVYSGNVQKTFKIRPAVWTGRKTDGVKKFRITNADDLAKGYEYTNIGVTPFIGLAAVLDDAAETQLSLMPGTDYKVSYSNYKKQGTGKAKIRFYGNYKGSAIADVTYAINKAEFNKAAMHIVMAKEVIYNAKKTSASTYKLSPGKNLFIELNGVMLKSGEYAVKFYLDGAEITNKTKVLMPENAAFMTVTVKITPKAGSKTYKLPNGVNEVEIGSYKIIKPDQTKKDVSKAKLTVIKRDGTGKAKIGYTGTKIGFDPEDALRQGDIRFTLGSGANAVVLTGNEVYENFEVNYANNVNRGTAVILLTAKEGSAYRGWVKGTFNIGKGTY